MNYGIGIFAMNKAFRFERDKDNEIRFLPIRNMEQVTLNDLVGYQLQKDLLVENTRAFVEGRNANNVLLYGDSAVSYTHLDVYKRQVIARQHGASTHNDCRQIHTQRSHQHARNDLVAVWNEHQPVKAVCICHRFHTVRDQFT